MTHACTGKIRYLTQQAATRAAAVMGYGTRPYPCGDHWHVGHPRRYDLRAYGTRGGVPTEQDWEQLRQMREER